MNKYYYLCEFPGSISLICGINNEIYYFAFLSRTKNKENFEYWSSWLFFNAWISLLIRLRNSLWWLNKYWSFLVTSGKERLDCTLHCCELCVFNEENKTNNSIIWPFIAKWSKFRAEWNSNLLATLGFLRTTLFPILIVALFGIALFAVSARIWLPGDMLAPAPIN